MSSSLSSIGLIQRAVNQFVSRAQIRVVVGAGTHVLEVFQLFGGVEIIGQQAIFRQINALNGLTNIWADATDGTNTVTVAASPGPDLSAALPGSRFWRGHDETQPFDYLISDQIRYYVPGLPEVKLARPYTLNAKNGVDNFGRVHFTTGGPMDVVFDVVFVWSPLDSGYIVCCG